MYPRNEAETIALYKLAEHQLPWRIVSMQTNRFPDAVVEASDGARLRVEFEYQSLNFLVHRHDPGGCDLIICWQDNWPGSPLPVWVLQDNLPPLNPLWEGWGSRLTQDLRSRVRKARLPKVAPPRENMCKQCRAESANLTKTQFLSQFYWFVLPGEVYMYMETEEDFMRVGDFLNKIARLPEVQAIVQEMEEAETVPV